MHILYPHIFAEYRALFNQHRIYSKKKSMCVLMPIKSEWYPAWYLVMYGFLYVCVETCVVCLVCVSHVCAVPLCV